MKQIIIESMNSQILCCPFCGKKALNHKGFTKGCEHVLYQVHDGGVHYLKDGIEISTEEIDDVIYDHAAAVGGMVLPRFATNSVHFVLTFLEQVDGLSDAYIGFYIDRR